jgi:hypothetical protein
LRVLEDLGLAVATIGSRLCRRSIAGLDSRPFGGINFAWLGCF